MKSKNFPNSLTTIAALVLVLTSSSINAQSRICIIDDQTGRHHCGWLADFWIATSSRFTRYATYLH